MACPYGASVKPGVSPTSEVVISRALWEQLSGTPSSWLDGILDTFTPSIVKVSDLCALNVSDPVDLSVTQIAAALSGEPIAILEVEQWAKAKLSYYEFTQVCVCNANPSAGCLALLAHDQVSWAQAVFTGATIYVGNRFTATVACVCRGAWWNTPTGSGTAALTLRLWSVTSGAKLAELTASGLPKGQWNEIDFSADVTLTAGQSYVISYALQDTDGYRYRTPETVSVSNTNSSGLTGVFNTSGATIPASSGSGNIYGLDPITCPASTTPPATTQPTQPGDLVLPPAWSCATACDIMVRLQQLSDRLDWIRRDVTLIQRQGVPFGYLLGAAHSGLIGSGTIAVAGILGVSVALTTVPATWGSTSDVPRRLVPKVGSLVLATANGNEDEQQLHYDQELVLGISAAVTSIKYSLRPGIVATITPLVREP